ncbi:hypothetical protein ST9NA_026 [Salmonella phage 9NA]|uniref:Uncharacterized protein n=1 Tax=Salmonella phage 9NA TaxID=1113547 RepID=A0A060D573_9CAUD|nr:hypothetical protein ST9NA_026 [Salmonella phage 9NA]AIB07029.1 hypothetical protein 9NA_026 [Salmonella phage 9NA]EGC6279311.1 hypothetical protein [Salmonella enterica]EJY0635059.1 hypothetical protein [Salmonella enterica subsp. enterica serovar Schwarzengrund]
MTIFKNAAGDTVAYLPKVVITDPACVDYDHRKQSDASYGDLCNDIIRGCDIGIERLQKLREEYEKRSVQAAMGLPPVFDTPTGV